MEGGRPVDAEGISGSVGSLAILYEDAHLLAVAKPPGLSTQAPPIAGATLETAVRAYLHGDGAGAAGGFVGTVHRLDRPVSGVVLWAKNPRAARRLSQQFERRQVHKEYWALVAGDPPPEGAGAGVWEDWLCREDTGLGRVQACAPGTPRAQRALTRWRSGRVAGLDPGVAWLRLEPETGRMHQLRVQAAARGWPVVGDALYGSTAPFPEGIALHARRLEVRHPVLERPLTFVAPLPASWPPALRGLAALERLPEDDGT
jgi:23S rRNA pseudouridine1911/1915/1917 synthase